MPKTLKNFIFSINIVLLSALFIIVLLFTSYLHTKLAQENAIKNSNLVSNQIFSSMYQVMKKGWSREELNEFMHSIKENFDESYSVNIYRGDKIKELFGEVDEKQKDDLAISVMESGEKIVFSDMGKLRNILPLNAKSECLSCHVNAKVGDTLGAIDVEQDFVEIIKDTLFDYIYFFFTVLPLFGLVAFLASRYTTSKITNALKLFNKKVKNINSIKDFKEFDSADIDTKFEEVNKIILNVDELAEKLKKIAVDKDLLEFEVKLLDKFIITSDVVQDWRDFINELLSDINQVMNINALMTIFKVGEDQFEVDIFWYGIPEQDVKKHFEEYVKRSINSNEYFMGSNDYVIRHNITNHNNSIISMNDYENFDHRTKSLFLDTPKIGGIVGLSLQSDIAADPLKHIVIDSILTTMANLVGSVKAINKYTKDLEYYASHDPLTELFNQRLFSELLDYEISRASRHEYPFALMVIDCDNFKPINDKYGHSFGDRYLQEFAKLLKGNKRGEDILSRYGGDEFTIILPSCDLDGSMEVSKRIVKAVENFKLLTPDGSYVGITVSIGISIFPTHAKTSKELFMIADSMMYRVKEDGKNSVKAPMNEDIVAVVKEQKAKSALLLDAIANNRIVPYFQPIQSSFSGENGIHELLMRISVDGKIISAYEFIEAAESMSVINQMDLMVIENAFKKIVEEKYEGILFINLSPKSLIVGNYADAITRLIRKYDISKDNIVFEITERETVTNFSILEKFVINLKMSGYKFAIDDFGSGFSSFHYIKKFPIDYLKIDGEFILNINKDKKDKAFVQSILTLAKELNVETIAEFVEDEETAVTLRKMGVDYMQGYHIGKPKGSFTPR